MLRHLLDDHRRHAFARARRAAPGRGCPSACAPRSASAARRRSCGRRAGRASRRGWGTARTARSGVHRRGAAVARAAAGAPTSRFSITVRSVKMRRSSGTKPRPSAADAVRRPAPRCRGRESAPAAALAPAGPSAPSASSTCRRRCGPSARRTSPRRTLEARRRRGSAPRRTRRRAPATSSSVVVRSCAHAPSCVVEGRAAAEVDLLHLRVVADLRRRALGDQPPRASTMMRSAWANTTSMLCSVKSTPMPRSTHQPLGQRHQLVALARRHAGGRLVHQQQLAAGWPARSPARPA